MCSCARLPHPALQPAPAPAPPPPNLKPKPAPTTRGPCPSPRTLVARAAPRRDDSTAPPPPPPSTFDFLALKRGLEEEEEEEVVAVEPRDGGGGDGLASEDDGDGEAKRSGGGGESSGGRKRRQMARRSGLLAKQVISVSSARSLGFVSQLWVDAASWIVALVEVRPSLLSGEAEKFLFEDIYQVGDVVLVEDETVVENEFKLVGLHSLVGYSVVTSRRRNVGKVRGFTFDINTGAMESLELDSFGISIVPSSLVSTYCLFVEDVLDIVSDTIVVHEDAISRVQRLTQGIWGTQNIQGPGGQMDDNGRYRRRKARRVQRQNGLRNSSGRKLHRKMRDRDGDWELPMDY
uniref:PRC-barrel domain-containing protein n=1 Tax=Oryza glumipatula TaxID=40148 RepID=A0A0D9Z6X1_9ORYZ